MKQTLLQGLIATGSPTTIPSEEEMNCMCVCGHTYGHHNAKKFTSDGKPSWGGACMPCNERKQKCLEFEPAFKLALAPIVHPPGFKMSSKFDDNGMIIHPETEPSQSQSADSDDSSEPSIKTTTTMIRKMV